jgi:uncharacterized protein (DUF2344 family)
MKIVIKFMKIGRMAYISHLDLQRTILRGLRAAGLTPVYSQGFNPHPKLSLALPLSLGFESVSEYAEAEIEDSKDSLAALADITKIRGHAIGTILRADPKHSTSGNALTKGAAVIALLNDALPEGIVVICAYAVSDEIGQSAANPQPKHSLASLVKYAAYDITAPTITVKDEPIATAAEFIDGYMAQEHIYVEKENRKKGRVDTIDIRPMIRSFQAERNIGNNKTRYICKISASSGAVLNPQLLIQSFYKHANNPTPPQEFKIVRTGISAD